MVDTTVNIEPTSVDDLAEIAINTADLSKSLLRTIQELRFCRSQTLEIIKHPNAVKVGKAVEIARKGDQSLLLRVKCKLTLPFCPEILNENYPFSVLEGSPLIF